MTASGLAVGRATAPEEGLGQPWRPAEGWTAIVAVCGLPFAVGWSLDDAGWLPGPAESTGYLMYLAVVATLLGVLLAKLGIGRFRAYLIGSFVGGLLIPFVAGNVILGDADPLRLDATVILERYRVAADVVRQVWIDLVVNGQPVTSQTGHYHMIFAAIVWAAGLLAATAAIGRRRPLDAVVVTGLLLLMDEALTAREQIEILVFFSISALVLLLRSHVFEEQVTWLRRRIGDPANVSALYVQSGAAFVGAAVIGALILTNVASSAPLQGAWADLPQHLADAGRWLQRFAPTGGDPRTPGIVSFGSNAVTTGLWAPDPNKVAFVAHLPPNDPRKYRWQVGAYADYTLFGWDSGATRDQSVPAGVPILAGTGDDPAVGVATTDVKITIQPAAFTDLTAISPATIGSVDQPTTLVGFGPAARFASVNLSGGGQYTVDALVPNIGDATAGITENRLRAAGRDYPPDITSLYLKLPANAVGPSAQDLLAQVELSLGGKAVAEAKPYDLAKALELYLSSPANFTYQTDVRAEKNQFCSGISTVECFARIRRGYCEYYASTMAVLLRSAGIPTRIAYGFLPGDRAPDGTETVAASAQHWWVEVYFPGTGWVEFDPTGTVGQPPNLPPGAVVTPAPSIGPVSSGNEPNIPRRSAGPNSGGGGTTGTTSGPGPFGVIAILLLAAVVAVVLAARRRPRVGRPMHPDTAWGGLGRLAGRLGYGPRPNQTVYEYAGALSELVPSATLELGTVARAKVEVTYGHQELGADRLRSVGAAYRSLRMAVLRAGLWRRLGRRRQ